MPAGSGRYPSGQRGQTVNLLAYAFGGSNPPLPTMLCVPQDVAELGPAVRGEPVNVTSDGYRIRRVPGASQGRVTADTGGNSSAVERQPSKLGVAGSNPVSRSRSCEMQAVRRLAPCRLRRATILGNRAHVAQTAERVLGKDEVSGSIPDMGSILVQRGIRAGNGR